MPGVHLDSVPFRTEKLKHKVIMEYYPTLKSINTILIASENLPAKV